MAKRAAADEQPYNPIDRALINAAVGQVKSEMPQQTEPVSRVASPAVAEHPRQIENRTGQTEPAVGGQEIGRGYTSSATPEFQRPHEEPKPLPHLQPQPHTDGRSRVSPSDPNDRFQDRRIPLSAGEDAELERLITAFATELGCKVKGTHVGRGLFSIFVDAYDHLLDRARRAPRIKRPGNGDPIGLMKFEQHVREVIEGGLRDYLTRGRGHR